jgi:hypothetical protein
MILQSQIVFSYAIVKCRGSAPAPRLRDFCKSLLRIFKTLKTLFDLSRFLKFFGVKDLFSKKVLVGVKGAKPP